jgi:hypothetical protein
MCARCTTSRRRGSSSLAPRALRFLQMLDGVATLVGDGEQEDLELRGGDGEQPRGCFCSRARLSRRLCWIVINAPATGQLCGDLS